MRGAPISIVVLAVLAAAGACGGSSRPDRPARSTDPAPHGEPAPAADRRLDEADCGRLLDRYIDLEQAELAATLPPEEVPTAEQVAAIRARMREEGMSGCVGQPRAPFDCAMAAPDKAALRACLDPG